MTAAWGRPAARLRGAKKEEPPVSRMRIVCAASLVIIGCVAVPASGGSDLRWEAWGENAVGGSASEGTHAWVTRGLYERGREIGLSKTASAAVAMAIMVAWEVYEVEAVDAQGVSVQDLVANAGGAAAGMAELGIQYSYATYRDPDDGGDHPWLGVPGLARNDLTYAVELERGGWTLGYKYLGVPGDLVIGTTSMPVLTGERGKQKVVAHVGRQWDGGWHCALGYDGHGGVTLGAGYRIVLGALGIDVSGLAGPDAFGAGLSGFIQYDSLF